MDWVCKLVVLIYAPLVSVLLATEDVCYFPKYSWGVCKCMVLLASATCWKRGTQGPAMGAYMLFIRTPELHSAILYLRVLTRTQVDASLAISIATNVLTTSLIAGRVWWHKQNVLKAFGEREC